MLRHLCVLLALSMTACSGASMSTPDVPARPEPARAFALERSPIPDAFRTMDLPFHGAFIERSGDAFMELTYRREQTVEQLVERWPTAVKAAGWVPISETPQPTGGLDASYTTPTGDTALLSIRPLGSLWVVTVTIREIPELRTE
jgi:hypothetical protein